SLARDAEAADVSRHALEHAQADPTMMFHSVWLTFDDAVAGRTAQAARSSGQHEIEHEELDAYFRMVHAMTKAMVKGQQGGRGAVGRWRRGGARSRRPPARIPNSTPPRQFPGRGRSASPESPATPSAFARCCGNGGPRKPRRCPRPSRPADVAPGANCVAFH